MTAPETDDALALQAQQGDRDAFASLVQRHTAPVWRLCRRLLGCAVEAEDATQEAFLRAWRGLPGYAPRERFLGWLLRIAQRVCLDRLRARREWAELTVEPQAPCAPVQETSSAEVARALDRLAPRERAVIHARFELGLQAPEIAARLELSPGNVRVILHRALRVLRRSLSPGASHD